MNDFENIEPLINLYINAFKCDVISYDLKTQIELVILRSDMEAPQEITFAKVIVFKCIQISFLETETFP